MLRSSKLQMLLLKILPFSAVNLTYSPSPSIGKACRRVRRIGQLPAKQTTMKIFAIPLVLFAAASLWGQATSGDLVGTVLDASAAGIPDATVEARNVVTNVKFLAKTNSK